VLFLPKNKIFAVFFAFLLPALENFTFAQAKETPFSTIKVGINAGSGRNSAFINNYWKLSGFGQGYVEFPFYSGQVGAGIALIRNNSRTADKPDFRSMFAYIGWGYEFRLPLNTSFSLAYRMGNYSMTFNDDTVNENLKTESEFAAGVQGGCSMLVYDNIEVSLGASYIKIFTKNKNNIILVNAGLSYKFVSPAWLKEIFQ
jgi:hypothetical protein